MAAPAKGWGSALTVGSLALSAAVLVAWQRWELRTPEPAIDLRMPARRGRWPVQLGAVLFGMPLFGNQSTLTTFLGARPDTASYGLAPSPLGPLVLVRHGPSTANAEGRFTGWVDVPLTRHGEAEAVAAAGLLGTAGLVPDVVHTSVMVRSIRSADLMLAALDRTWIPVRRTWRLNERQVRRPDRTRQEGGESGGRG
ncbi:2,3-bisphosphoglycerate-dependent phosphoglycerate mutase [Streptomyces antibioticus]